MSAPATKAGTGDVARKNDASGFVPFRRCCECGGYERVFAYWEEGNAAVCGEVCNALKAAKEKLRPYYLPAHLSPIVEDDAD